MGQIATPATGVEKSRKALDRAVIRFAGDSGDGMQLTGEQFTTESAWAGNDLATLAELPGGDSRAGRHSVRCLELPAPVREPACLHAGRSPRLSGRDESRRAQGSPARPQDRRSADREHAGVRQAQSGQGGLRRESARRAGAGRALPLAQGRHDRPHARGHQGSSAQHQGEGPDQELLRARPGLVDLHAAARADPGLDREAVRQEQGHRRGKHARPEGRPRLRRDRGDLLASTTRSSPPRWRPASTGR